MSFQAFPLPYPSQMQTGIPSGLPAGAVKFPVSTSANPAAFAGVTAQTGSIAYDGGSAPNAFSSIAFNFYGQTQGITESASATFTGTTADPDVPPSTITIPYGGICTGMTVYTTSQAPLQPYVSGIVLTWTGLNGAESTQTIGVRGNSVIYSLNVQSLIGGTVVPIGFFWYGLPYNGNYYMVNLGLVNGTYPTSVSYASLQSTGAVTTSLAAAQTLGTSATVVNTTFAEQTSFLTASYSVATLQTVSDTNTAGAATSPSVISSTPFSQIIAVADASTGATTDFSVTATVSDATALTVPSATTAVETSSQEVTVGPGSSVQLVVTGNALTSPISFSASGTATYTWPTFEGGQRSQDVSATVTFAAYQTTLDITSSVVLVS